MSIDRRKHRRYEVEGLAKIKGRFSPLSSVCKLVTLSEGGCGFVVPEAESQLKKNSILRCVISYEGIGEVELEGELLYDYPHPYTHTDGRFLGLRFLDPQKIRAIFEAVDAELAPQPKKRAHSKKK